MLVPVDWYETFFREMDRCLEGSDRKVEYSVQTNISILKPEIIDLFRKHEVHFSVHYDGELDDPKLLSKKRKENIIALRENGLAVTVLVVGTVESLKALPASIEFFNSQGIRFYRVNYVSSQGRGGRVSLIPPELRAEAEFEAAFLASQFDFNTRDNVVMNKFLHYYNNVICGSPYSTAPRPQDCMAGVRSAYVAADGLIYPCSFFPGITGPMVRAKDLPSGNMEEAAAAVAMCKRSNAYYDERCPSCQALPICGEYCPLSPVTDTNFMESFCSAQVTLRRMMDRNRILSELVGGGSSSTSDPIPGCFQVLRDTGQTWTPPSPHPSFLRIRDRKTGRHPARHGLNLSDRDDAAFRETAQQELHRHDRRSMRRAPRERSLFRRTRPVPQAVDGVGDGPRDR
jgi:radical SAM protein with 4Fe4S-binding SPASM domain